MRLARDPAEPVTGSSPGSDAGTLFALIGQIGGDAGFLPLALVQLTVAVTVVVIATSLRQPWLPRGRGLAPVFAFGLLGSAALLFFQLALQHGLLTIVAALADPAATWITAQVIGVDGGFGLV